jgi:pyridoxamine 5'-phosphate oxidase
MCVCVCVWLLFSKFCIKIETKPPTLGNMKASTFQNDESQEYDHPMTKFAEWYKVVSELDDEKDTKSQCSSSFDYNAMTVATCTSDGYPSCRTVYMKHFDKNGVIFCTNFDSRKGKEIQMNPNVACVFYWTLPITRQIRIEGKAVALSHEENEKYFHQRPIKSQIASAISLQSQPVASRKVLCELFEQKLRQFEESAQATIPCPPHWGAYRVSPKSIEFWQEGEHRLADRILYTRQNDDGSHWTVTRLFP